MLSTALPAPPFLGAPPALKPLFAHDQPERRHGYLFGQKITHSLSPLLHQVVYDDLGLNWVQSRFDSADLSQFLQLAQDASFYGASITMPNKIAILPFLDEMTPECREVGACNTVFLRERDGKRILCGTNTDVIGIRDSFQRNVPEPSSTYHNRPALVIGGGGAARSAVYALRKWMHVTDIYLVNRDQGEVDAIMAECALRGYGHAIRHIATVEEAHAVPAGPGAIVACVPDFDPQTEAELRARQVTEVLLAKGEGKGEGEHKKGAMLDMCYNPTPFTKLGALAERLGWQVILGTEALIWQGLEQDRYWTGLDTHQLPVAKVQEAIGDMVAQRSQSRL